MNRKICIERMGGKWPWTSYLLSDRAWIIATWKTGQSAYWLDTKGVLAELREIVK